MSDSQSVRCTSATATALRIEWTKPEFQLPITQFEGYEIKSRCSSEDSFETFGKTQETEFILRNLKSDTSYEIRIYYVIDGDATKLHTLTTKTQYSLVPSLIKMSTQQWMKPAIYKLNPHKIIHLSDDLRELHMISEYKPLPLCEPILNEKNLLVLGATGSGKSTLVDAMLNYVVDVPFRDDCRFKMVDLTEVEQNLGTTQVLSVTSGVTCYRIPRKEGFNIDFQLNVIDTPGFGDTRGEDFDIRISGMIETLFKTSVTYLDAVCIVLPLSSHRLTEAQKYVFNNIVRLFAKNVKDNLFAMITHDDGGEMQCISALAAAEIHVAEHFKFNNSDLFSKDPSVEQWNKREDNFAKFFKQLDGVGRVCLKDSQKVIETQMDLKVQLERIQEKIRKQVQAVNNIRNESAVMEKYKTEIETNKNFTYKEITCVHELNYSARQSLNCPECKTTCHPGCWVPFDAFRYTCEVMKEDRCTICEKKCSSSSHRRQNSTYILKYVEVIKTSEDLHKKYDCAVAEKERHTSLLEKEKIHLKESLEQLDTMMGQVSQWIKELNEMAFKSENRTICTFLDELIDMESKGKQPQFEQRIGMLKRIKENFVKNKKIVGSIDELLQYE